LSYWDWVWPRLLLLAGSDFERSVVLCVVRVSDLFVNFSKFSRKYKEPLERTLLDNSRMGRLADIPVNQSLS
jgi:hypothetical protein